MKQYIRKIGKTGVILMLLVAMICTLLPGQAWAAETPSETETDLEHRPKENTRTMTDEKDEPEETPDTDTEGDTEAVRKPSEESDVEPTDQNTSEESDAEPGKNQTEESDAETTDQNTSEEPNAEPTDQNTSEEPGAEPDLKPQEEPDTKPDETLKEDQVTEEPESEEKQDVNDINEKTEDHSKKEPKADEKASADPQPSEEKNQESEPEPNMVTPSDSPIDSSKEDKSEEDGTDQTPENGLMWQEHGYVLYIDGLPVTEAGWKEIAQEKFQVGAEGTVTSRMEEEKGVFRLYRNASGSQEWVIQKNLWEEVLGKEYYFNDSGICSRLYETESKQLFVYLDGKMILAANKPYELKDGKLYFFDARGIRDTIKGWKQITANEWYYVNQEGRVSSKMRNEGGIWKYYKHSNRTWKIQKDIWQKIDKKEYYFNTSGICTKIYDTKTKKCQIYRNGKMVTLKKEVCSLRDGKLYFFNEKGIRVTKAGWQKISSKKYVQIGKKGYIANKLEKKKDAFWYQTYDYKKKAWKNKKDVWLAVDGKEYYFNKSGRCTKLYTTKTKKCQIYRNGKMITLKKDVCSLKNGKLYFFNSKGTRVTKASWQQISSKKYVQIGKAGYVACKLEKSKDTWKYQGYNYQKKKWENKKNIWAAVDGKEYYFNKSGRCTKLYTAKTKKCQIYRNGKMVTLKKEACTLKNGKLYYFNGKGIRVTKKSWQKISGNKYIQIGSKGYVVSKIEKTKNIWKYHKYSYQKKKWLKQKNVWLTVSKKKYYFNNAGNCTHIYDSAAQKYYDYRDGAMTVVKNDVRSIGKKEYYFGSNGIKSSVPGLYLTASGTLVYAAADGCVTKKIYGEIQAYTEAEGRITSCRIKEDHYMSYYNGNGDAVRKIDLYQPMVALTYDDGPSVHTWAILDVLAQNGGVATFFVVGQQVPANSAVVRRAVELGCEIGNHTYSHQNLTKVGVAAIQSQIWTTNFMVQNAAGVCPVVMRPPGGNYNHTVQNTVGMPIILWSIDTLDWKTRNAASTQAAVLNHVKDGDIILMHDLYSQTADASRVIIPELKNRGYQLVTISELADCRGPIYGGGVYHSLP